jgi:phospholipid/cholesterol/gamma-HCH transport system ATP-binding protein
MSAKPTHVADERSAESPGKAERVENSDDVIIRFTDVHKSFGAQKVLDGLTFDVTRGRTLAIMGPSGTGKSVVLRHVIGLIAPDSGQVEVEGQSVTGLRRKELAALRRRMGYLFQEGALINWLSVGENVCLPLRENTDLSDKEIRQRAEEKLALVRVEGAWDKMPSEISGGMKKRVGLARALITDPEIILYDEPNAGLDPEISASINELIHELKERLHCTAIVVEHRVNCIKTVADEVLFLEKGKALLRLPPREFFASDNPRIVQFLGKDPD